ncbi:Hypothetical protein NTJ_02318 [Nesidiocoris tenuis]|uniref:Uncharacterized protein n=1 Tax=Nesidiocoris tenuis TaxID=355587 RepID=A0ABN7AB14_9HEMI|nr:Hypothetical protein NTJ_02318 [Nesidiocoris tenuis]
MMRSVYYYGSTACYLFDFVPFFPIGGKNGQHSRRMWAACENESESAGVEGDPPPPGQPPTGKAADIKEVVRPSGPSANPLAIRTPFDYS